MPAETVIREDLVEARATLDEVGRELKDVKRRQKKLASAGKTSPDDDQAIVDMERRYRNLRAQLRRKEAVVGGRDDA
jgi:hypothetical protein